MVVTHHGLCALTMYFLVDNLFYWEGMYEPKRGKFAPNAKKGVFLGYNIQAGHVWSGEYLVANSEC